jgi:signal transduction histidine kinase
MIMEKHGGEIDAMSEEGEGATFILRFPSANT